MHLVVLGRSHREVCHSPRLGPFGASTTNREGSPHAMGAAGAHHGVGYAPRPRAYGPRASTDTRGGSPSAAGQAGGR